MNRRDRIAIGWLGVTLVAHGASAQAFSILERCSTVTYNFLQARAVTPDGRVVVASDSGNVGGKTYRFTRLETGWQCQPVLASGDRDKAVACAPDGSAIVGECVSAPAFPCKTWRWHEGGTDCTDLSPITGAYQYFLLAASDDTRVTLMGRYQASTGVELVHVDRLGQAYPLGIYASSAARLSSDGSRGYADARNSNGTYGLYTWQEGQAPQAIPMPPLVTRMYPVRIGADGVSLLALGNPNDSNSVPWIWTPSGGWQLIDELRGLRLFDATPDFSAMVLSGSGGPVHWSVSTGLRSIATLIQGTGHPISPSDLLTQTFISADGQTITGTLNTYPGQAPWVLRLGAQCDPDLNRDGNADQDDLAYLVDVLAGGPNPTGIDPDFNHDGNADQTDVAALVDTLAGGGCP